MRGNLFDLFSFVFLTPKTRSERKSPEVKHVPSRARRQLAESSQGRTMTPHSTSAMCAAGGDGGVHDAGVFNGSQPSQ